MQFSLHAYQRLIEPFPLAGTAAAAAAEAAAASRGALEAAAGELAAVEAFLQCSAGAAVAAAAVHVRP